MEMELLKMGIRFVVFAGVFWLAARRMENVKVTPKWALPLVGVVFGLLNVGLYWALKPLLSVATVGVFGFLIPFALNALFLRLTIPIVAKLRTKLEIEGTMTMVKLCVLVTIAHGALWLLLDIIS